MKLLYFQGLLSIVLFLATINEATAQANFEWAEADGGNLGDSGLDVYTDINGNSYVTGYFGGTATFGTSVSLSSSGPNGNPDIFVAKYDDAGTLLWAVNAGGANDDQGLSITVDNLGNVYITGRYNGTANFSGTSITSKTFTYDDVDYYSSDDIFVAKYNNSGVLQWVTSAGGPGTDIGYSIATDDLGNLYVTGYFNETAGFRTAPLVTTGEVDLVSEGGQDIFVAVYNSLNGALIRTNGYGDIYDDAAMDIAVDDLGTSYLTGYFTGEVNFGNNNSVSSVTDAFNSGPSQDIFVVSFNSSGTALWASGAGGSWTDQANGIDIDANGNSYITGFYGGTASFGSYNVTSEGGETFPGDPMIYYFGAEDIFISKLNSSGSFQWVQSAGDDNPDEGLSIVTDLSGNSTVTGFFNGSATFGTAPQITSTLDSDDIFVVRLNSAGTTEWALSAGGPQADKGYGINTSSPPNFFLTGSFNNTALFGSAGSETSSGNEDIFLAHLNDPTITLPVSLIKFTALRENNSALLSWSTATEENNSGFEIEVSTTNTDFRKLASVATKNGNSSFVQNYNFTDSDITNSGTRYYRLIQVDTDGKKNHIGTRAVRFDFMGTTSLSAGPNPFQKSFQVFIESDSEQSGIIILTDVTGRSISKNKLQLKKGGNTYSLENLENLSKGMYFLSLDCSEKVITIRMVKQ